MRPEWPHVSEACQEIEGEREASENVSILAGCFIHIIASLCGLVSFSTVFIIL